MILVIDVGNTNITFGVYDHNKLKTSFRMISQTEHTSDEYGIKLLNLLMANGIDRDSIEGCMIASVVPKIMHSLVNSVIKYLGKRPYIVGPGIKTGIRIDMDNPKEMGPDLIVDAVGGYEKYGGPIIVVDFGTATTYFLVDENGVYTCGVVTPGVKISAKALWSDTARLPEIELKMTDTILAKDTITAMQAGIMYGQVGQVNYIIDEMKRQSGLENIKVIATGGMGRVISENSDRIDIYDKDLTLDGLMLLYKKNKRTKPKAEDFEE